MATKKKNYFGEDQEQAVEDYINSDCPIEKNRIYEQFLKKPLITMTESIIRRYDLYSKDMYYEELHTDTLSFLITKIDKFSPNKISKKTGLKTRAYSYFQTIIRNRLLGVIDSENKNRKKVNLYDDAFNTFGDNPNYTYEIDYSIGESPIQKLIHGIVDTIKVELDCADLTPNERRVGYAVVNLFENIEDILEESNNKFNKNIILKYMRDYTFLTTKEIRHSLKRFKSLYFLMKTDMIENDEF